MNLQFLGAARQILLQAGRSMSAIFPIFSLYAKLS